MCIVLAVKILCFCVASLGALFAWYIWKSNKTINQLIDCSEFYKKAIRDLDGASLKDAEYIQCCLLLIEGLYNVHPKGGKLRKEDIDFIKKVLDKKTDYVMKLNPIKDNSLKN